jgi:hypothetical protein
MSAISCSHIVEDIQHLLTMAEIPDDANHITIEPAILRLGLPTSILLASECPGRCSSLRVA